MQASEFTMDLESVVRSLHYELRAQMRCTSSGGRLAGSSVGVYTDEVAQSRN
jgi:hypothetical protein